MGSFIYKIDIIKLNSLVDDKIENEQCKENMSKFTVHSCRIGKHECLTLITLFENNIFWMIGRLPKQWKIGHSLNIYYKIINVNGNFQNWVHHIDNIDLGISHKPQF